MFFQNVGCNFDRGHLAGILDVCVTHVVSSARDQTLCVGRTAPDQQDSDVSLQPIRDGPAIAEALKRSGIKLMIDHPNLRRRIVRHLHRLTNRLMTARHDGLHSFQILSISQWIG
jgi:hypothetical protein